MKLITSKYAVVQKSRIHHNGMFATIDIPKGTEIIEYVGERITKKLALKRANEAEKASEKNHSKGAVYLFEINKKYDIDGDVPWNTAKYINHSCDPNCETEQDEKDKIWITSMGNIKKGEEITYNYCYDIDVSEDHPCKCGTLRCVGYIADEKDWPKLKKKLEKNKKL